MLNLQFVGSKYFKVDFHCHSPASDDFPRDNSKVKCSNREWLLGLMRKEIDCVVLSDHNTAAGIDPIAFELEGLRLESESQPDNGYRPLVILPAVELTAVDSTHVLAIFRENTSSTIIESFISQLDLPMAIRDNHTLVLGLGTRSIISKARSFNHEILIIPAHIDEHKGVFKNTHQAAVEDIFAAEPHAVELIHSPSDLKHSYQKQLIKSLAQVKGSDAHSIEEMGRGYTWVKMVVPSFDGIKIALTDPEHCIIRSPGTPPNVSTKYITKLSVKSSLCKTSENNPIEVDFSPWYTALVGSRGSGKSTLIESIRLALRRDTDKQLTIDQAKTLTKFKKEAFDTDSIICVEYSKDNELYKFEWTQSGTKMYHRNDVGAWELEERFNTSRFPVSIYSQKMLYEIATKNDAFLSVIDASEIVNFDKWKAEKEEFEVAYRGACNQYRLAKQEVANLTLIQGLYDDVERKLTVLKNSGLAPLQQKLKEMQFDYNRANSAIEILDDQLKELKTVNESAIRSEVIEENSDLSKFLTGVATTQSEFSSDISLLCEKYTNAISTLRSSEYYQVLSDSLDATKLELQGEVAKLESAQISEDELSSLMESEEKLKAQLTTGQDRQLKVKQVLHQKNESYDKLVDHSKKLTKLRIEFIESLENDDLSVDILPLAGDINSTVSGYQKHSGIERFKQHIYDEENSSSMFTDLCNINRHMPTSGDMRYAELHKLKQYHQNIASGTESTEYNSLHGSLRKRISDMTQDQIDTLMCWFPDDGLNIKFKDSENQFRQLDSASPGQKSASMLSFLMSYGKDPLILDQPEDDLDCGMLSSSVIPAIKKNKINRQLILVTHSAPIVVNGDAEYVFAMKQQSKKLQPVMSGGLQEQGVKDLICSQMEGGETAFKTRYKRILG